MPQVLPRARAWLIKSAICCAVAGSAAGGAAQAAADNAAAKSAVWRVFTVFPFVFICATVGRLFRRPLPFALSAGKRARLYSKPFARVRVLPCGGNKEAV